MLHLSNLLSLRCQFIADQCFAHFSLIANIIYILWSIKKQHSKCNILKCRLCNKNFKFIFLICQYLLQFWWALLLPSCNYHVPSKWQKIKYILDKIISTVAELLGESYFVLAKNIRIKGKKFTECKLKGHFFGTSSVTESLPPPFSFHLYLNILMALTFLKNLTRYKLTLCNNKKWKNILTFVCVSIWMPILIILNRFVLKPHLSPIFCWLI